MLLLDDLHWMDGDSLDLVRYLGHYWKDHASRVLLLGTVRREGPELTPQLSAQLVDLSRDLPITQITLQPLSQEETFQLVEAIVGKEEQDCRNAEERRERVTAEAIQGGAGPAARRG